MNVYEEAHSLARAIKESNEFKEFDESRKILDSDPDLKNMVADLQKKQLEMQAKQMSGEEMGTEMMQQLQSMYTMLSSKPGASKYLEAQARFSLMMKDVYEILSDAMGIHPGDFGL